MLIAIIYVLLSVSSAMAAGAPVVVDSGDTITSVADTTVTSAAAVLVAASSTTRAYLNCTTDAPVRWGSSSVSLTSGQLIVASGSLSTSSRAAIYMIAEDVTATVSCTVESFSSASSTGVFSP